MSIAFRRRIAGRKAAVFVAVFTIGAMFLVAPTAQAASSAGLSGAFSVAEVVTAPQNVVSEPVGFSTTVSWNFVPGCASGPCATSHSPPHGWRPNDIHGYSRHEWQLHREHQLLRVMLFQCKRPAHCARCVHRCGINSISATASSGSLVTAFKGTLSITGTPTAIGTANNCNPSYEVITFTGTTATPPPIISDSYASVEYIQGFSVSGCIKRPLAARNLWQQRVPRCKRGKCSCSSNATL